MPRDTTLLDLARDRFPDGLTPAERELFLKAPGGEPVSLGEDEEPDPAQAKDWGPKQTIRADRLHWLCTDARATALVHASGLVIVGALIFGTLDLQAATIPFRVGLFHCALPWPLLLLDARTMGVHLDYSHLHGLDAERMICEGNCSLRHMTVQGEINLATTMIHGQLACTGTQLENPQGYALRADGTHVTGGVFLDDGFQAKGEVRLPGADIRGQLSCPSARFENSQGTALNAHGIHVTNNVFLNDGFQAMGEVRLLGADIKGQLNCSGAQLENPQGCVLNADTIRVRGDVFLNDKFQAKGEVRLPGANIGGQLNCSGAHLENPQGKALNADSITITGGVILRDGFRATGEVWISGANIGGQLDCSGARLENPQGTALDAQIMHVKGGLLLTGGFRAMGEVRLIGADLGIQLACSGALLENPQGVALNASGIRVTNGVFLNDGFQAVGAILLPEAAIDGQLVCRGGRFDNPDALALGLNGATIKDAAFLDEQFRAMGLVSLDGTEIHGYLRCDAGRFENPGGTALSADSLTVHGFLGLRHGFMARGFVNLTRAKVHGTFQYHHLEAPADAQLSLEYADLGVLVDEEASWPAQGNLRLHGLVYKDIHHTAPRDAASRKRWLALQPAGAHTPGAYEQLATALRRAGHERDAREILIEKNRRRRDFDPNMGLLGRVAHFLFGLFLGYGYGPLTPLKWILPLVLLGAAVFHSADQSGLMTRAQAWNIRQGPEVAATMQGDPYPRFCALAYSLDTFVPFIDLDQEDYWIPANVERAGSLGLATVILEPGHVVLADLQDLPCAPSVLLSWFFCLHVLLGWVFTGLLVVGITGMLQRRSE